MALDVASVFDGHATHSARAERLTVLRTDAVANLRASADLVIGQIVTIILIYGTVQSLRGRKAGIGECLAQGFARLPAAIGVAILGVIAYVLGLSHALNIAFFTALAGSGEAAPRLAQLSSTTYDAQVDVATKVAGESPELYFEIQHLNEYGRESLQALRAAVEVLCQSVTTGDARQFAEMMQRGREYLAGRARPEGA